MSYIDVAAIEQRARALRAADMRRQGAVFAPRMKLYFSLMATTLTNFGETAAEALRPLFSWNPTAAGHK